MDYGEGIRIPHGNNVGLGKIVMPGITKIVGRVCGGKTWGGSVIRKVWKEKVDGGEHRLGVRGLRRKRLQDEDDKDGVWKRRC